MNTENVLLYLPIYLSNLTSLTDQKGFHNATFRYLQSYLRAGTVKEMKEMKTKRPWQYSTSENNNNMIITPRFARIQFNLAKGSKRLSSGHIHILVLRAAIARRTESSYENKTVRGTLIPSKMTKNWPSFARIHSCSISQGQWKASGSDERNKKRLNSTHLHIYVVATIMADRYLIYKTKNWICTKTFRTKNDFESSFMFDERNNR